MELANPHVDAVGWGDVTYRPTSGCVFDLPEACGQHWLRFPHLGWRWPLPEDWGPPVPAPVAAVVVTDLPPTGVAPVVPDTLPAAKPEAVEGRRAPLRPEDAQVLADAQRAEDETDPTPDGWGVDGPPAPTTGQPVQPAAAAPARPRTLADKLLADAHEAGPAGITSAGSVAAHGRKAYDELALLATNGRLVKVRRGVYVHPDHAPAATR